MNNIVYFAYDQENYTMDSAYWKANQATAAYAASVCRINMKLADKEWILTEDKFEKVFLNPNGCLGELIDFFLNLDNRKKYKWGYNVTMFAHNGGKWDTTFINDWIKVNLSAEQEIRKVEDVVDPDTNKIYFNIIYSPNYKTTTLYKFIKKGKVRKGPRAGEQNYAVMSLVFADSLRIFRMSVKDMGVELGLTKGDTMRSISKAEEKILTQEEIEQDKELIEYVQLDSVILARYFEKWREKWPKSTSLPMTSTSWAKSEFYNSLQWPANIDEKQIKIMGYMESFRAFILRKSRENQIKLNVDLRDMYRGGISSVNYNCLQQWISNIIVLDYKSLYPSVMFNWQFPVGKFEFVEGITAQIALDNHQLGLYEVVYIDVHSDERVPAILDPQYDVSDLPKWVLGHLSKTKNLRPKKMKMKQINYYERDEDEMTQLLHHAQWCVVKGTWNEIEAFENLVTYSHRFVIKGWVWKQYETKIFQKFVTKHYTLKETDKPHKGFHKLSLNGLSGSFAQKDIDESWITPYMKEKNTDVEDPYFIQISDKPYGYLGWYHAYSMKDRTKKSYGAINLELSCFITSYGRTKLLLAMKQAIDLGFTVAYCDTDSLFMCHATPALAKEQFEYFVNNTGYFPEPNTTVMGTLGTLEVDDKVGYFENKLFVLGAKKYIITNPEETKIVKCGTAGINTDLVKEQGIEHFISNKVYYDKQAFIVKGGSVIKTMPKNIIGIGKWLNMKIQLKNESWKQINKFKVDEWFTNKSEEEEPMQEYEKPDWIKDFEANEQTESEYTDSTPEMEELPDWMIDDSAQPAITMKKSK